MKEYTIRFYFNDTPGNTCDIPIRATIRAQAVYILSFENMGLLGVEKSGMKLLDRLHGIAHHITVNVNNQNHPLLEWEGITPRVTSIVAHFDTSMNERLTIATQLLAGMLANKNLFWTGGAQYTHTKIEGLENSTLHVLELADQLIKNEKMTH